MKPLLIAILLLGLPSALFAQGNGADAIDQLPSERVQSDVYFFSRPINDNELQENLDFQEATIEKSNRSSFHYPVAYSEETRQFYLKLPNDTRILLLSQIDRLQWKDQTLRSVPTQTESGVYDQIAILLVDGNAQLYRAFDQKETRYFSRLEDNEYAEVLGVKRKDLRMVLFEKIDRIESLLSQHRVFNSEPLLVRLFELYNG